MEYCKGGVVARVLQCSAEEEPGRVLKVLKPVLLLLLMYALFYQLDVSGGGVLTARNSGGGVNTLDALAWAQ